MVDNSLGNKIRQYRKLRALTQEQLAEKIGIDNKHLSRIEKGRHMPTYNIIKKLAKVLDFDIYSIEDTPIEEFPKQSKVYLKSLQILNSAKNEEEERYYYEVLKIAQRGLNIGIIHNKHIRSGRRGSSWICFTLGKFRNRTFGSSLLNFLATRISLRSIRPQIRRTRNGLVLASIYLTK